MEPNDLAGQFMQAAKAGDVDGLVRLYEESAVLELPDGGQAVGHGAIRDFYAAMLAAQPTFDQATSQRPALVNGDLALTGVGVGEDATAEVARRQPDGTWRWVLDRPSTRGLRVPGGESPPAS
jgi:ketosteroid isomerase-like protein